ncbi:MAG: heparinase II/III family protein [Pseudomonadota bacterium]
MDLQLAGFVATEMLRSSARAVLNAPPLRWRYSGSRSARLSIAPQDLRTADPTVAAEIYAGRFAFAGKFALANGRSPFEIVPPSEEWAKALYGFGWMRHLRAADSALSRANARALVEEWIDMQGRWHSLAWNIEITARRVLAWLAQSPLVLEQADIAFYRKFAASLTKQVDYLISMRRLMRPSLMRLQVTIALAQAALCLEQQSLQRRSARWLEKELKAQILADGGHMSRNPGLILQILLDILPLRHSYVALSLMPPQMLLTAIDRMMPMVRFFRHGDGAVALFNGMGPTPADIIATLLAYDETRGEPPLSAPVSGYQRLQMKDILVMADAGAAPPVLFSQEAHAGALSFEFSDAADRIVVNCGMPWAARKTWEPVVRHTSAHSTLEIENISSADFPRKALTKKLLGPVMTHGPRRVACETESNSIQSELVMSHDGYARSLGCIHQRHMTLTTDGREVLGVDEILPASGKNLPEDIAYALRFHLHPYVRASLVRDGEGVLLLLMSGRAWKFTAAGMKAAIEESLYFGGADGARRCEQIVLRGSLAQMSQIRWRFSRCQPLFSEKLAQQENKELDLPL